VVWIDFVWFFISVTTLLPHSGKIVEFKSA